MNANKCLSALALIFCMVLVAYADFKPLDSSVAVEKSGVFDEPKVLLARVDIRR